MEKIRIEQHSFTGGLWIAMWFFSIGFLKMSFLKGLIAVILWPYFLGAALSKFL